MTESVRNVIDVTTDIVHRSIFPKGELKPGNSPHREFTLCQLSLSSIRWAREHGPVTCMECIDAGA